MYCMKCGAQIPEDCVFCPRCGTQLRPAGPPELRPRSSKAKKRRIAIFVLAGCMAFALLIQLYAVLLYRDVYVVTYDGSNVEQVSMFAPVVLAFALILAGCMVTMHLKKTVPCIVFSCVNVVLAFSTSFGLMEIGKRMNGVKGETLNALTILASCNIVYLYLALAALILVILNRKTL